MQVPAQRDEAQIAKAPGRDLAGVDGELGDAGQRQASPG